MEYLKCLGGELINGKANIGQVGVGIWLKTQSKELVKLGEPILEVVIPERLISKSEWHIGSLERVCIVQ